MTLLTNEENELTTRQDLFLASVSLIEALGGRWDTKLLPTQEELQKAFSLSRNSRHNENEQQPNRESPTIFCPNP